MIQDVILLEKMQNQKIQDFLELIYQIYNTNIQTFEDIDLIFDLDETNINSQTQPNQIKQVLSCVQQFNIFFNILQKTELNLESDKQKNTLFLLENKITKFIQNFSKTIFDVQYFLSQVSDCKKQLNLLLLLIMMPKNFLQRNTKSIEIISQIFSKLEVKSTRIDFIQLWQNTLKTMNQDQILNHLLTISEISNTWISVNIAIRDRPRRRVGTLDLLPIKDKLIKILEIMQLIQTYKTQLLSDPKIVQQVTLSLENNYINSNAYDILPDINFYLNQFNSNIPLIQKYPKDFFSILEYQFLISPNTKQKILYYEITQNIRPIKVSIRRDNVAYDLLQYILKITNNDYNNPKYQKLLRTPIAIKFANEEGIDAGGLSSEFFSLWWSEILETKYNLFTLNKESNLFWINKFPLLDDKEEQLQYTYVGFVIAYSLLNFVLIENKFPSMFWKLLMNQKANLKDLKEFDFQMFQSLNFILNCNDQEEIADLCLTFSVNENVFGKIEKIDLIEKGSEIDVTLFNKNDYVETMVDYITNKSIYRQMSYIRKGFNIILSGIALSMFSFEELMSCLCGDEILDFNELKRVCVYEQPYNDGVQVIQWFWEVLLSFNEEQKKKFMKFTFACEKAPAGGLKNSRFEIRKNGEDDNRLPTTHTCFGILLLPQYSSKQILQEKLLQAIEYNEYFGLE